MTIPLGVLHKELLLMSQTVQLVIFIRGDTAVGCNLYMDHSFYVKWGREVPAPMIFHLACSRYNFRISELGQQFLQQDFLQGFFEGGGGVGIDENKVQIRRFFHETNLLLKWIWS